MTGKIVSLEGVDVKEFYGVSDASLEYLASKCKGVSISGRGEKILINGDDPDVIDKITKKVQRLVDYVLKYGHISNRVIDQVFDAVSYDGASPAITEKEPKDKDIILYGVNGTAIKARSVNQQLIVTSIEKCDLVFAVGPAGSGKTYTGIALAVKALKNREVKRIILTRPAVEAGERLGFLPGDMKEKLDPYLQPLYDALNDMIPQKKLEEYVASGVIQIAPLAFMRGRTLDNAFVILDEAQNATTQQLKMFLTRMGRNAKFFVTGDMTQIDLPKITDSGLIHSLEFLSKIEGVATIYMQESDIVRHPLVREIVKVYDINNNNR
ncbi:MAG: PhoH family protein [Rikenellaceae bacterium]